MSLFDIRNSQQQGTNIRTSDLDLYIEALTDTDSERAYSKAKWLTNPQGAGLTTVPETHLAIAHTQACLDRSHSDYRPHISADHLEAVHTHVGALGEFHKLAERRYEETWAAGAPNGLPFPAATVEWPMFSASWPIMTKDAATGGWALHLATTAGKFADAADILNHVSASSPLQHVAELALNYHTSRWGDLIDAVQRARSATFFDHGHPISDQVLVDIAAAVGAEAHLRLGETTQAQPLAEAAANSQVTTVAAHGYYVQGLMERLDGHADKAQAKLAQSISIMHTARAQDALSHPDEKVRVTSRETIAQRTDRWDELTEPNPEMEAERKRKDTRASWQAEADALLDRQVGMEGVISQLHRITRHVRVSEERRRRMGAKAAPTNFNLVITGPPGTGKTTITKAYALYLAASGVVDEPEVNALTKADLVSKYIGETPEKVKTALHNGIGKVTTIDEFYSIVQDTGGAGDNSQSHGQDAIDAIVSESELLIGKSVIIIMGYRDDMQRILQTNEGLESRFPRRIDFPSFTLEQLAAVTRIKAEDQGLRLSDEAYDFLANSNGYARTVYQETPSGRSVIDTLGNGRLARNIAERAGEELSNELYDQDLSTLSDEDLSTIQVRHVEQALRAYVEAALMGRSTE